MSPPGSLYFLVGHSYKASFVTVTGRAREDNPLCTVTELRPQSAASVDSVVLGAQLHHEGTILNTKRLI